MFRFAPSPNGLLHRGHALSALLNQRAADRSGGRLLVRTENIDLGRARPDFEAAILEDLAWLGLRWEEPVMRQSGRFEAYRAALGELAAAGLAYPAFMSRGEIQAKLQARDAAGRRWPRDPDGAPLYPGEERDWSAARRAAAMRTGRPYALRLDMRRALEGAPPLSWREADPVGQEAGGSVAADPASWGDIVLARRDAEASYHLAVVVDDAFQGVTHVVRGADLRAATSVHRLLQRLLGLPEPLYFHHRLILDATGAKLSKSRGSESLRARRAAGETPATLAAGIGLPAPGELA